MASLEIQNVVKSFGEVPVVRDINISVADGEFVVLVGPSGCGKSTLLRMIAGLEPLNSGKITIGARDVTDLPAKARDIAMVFQNYALYPHMTVAENMSFALRLKKVAPDEIKRRTGRAAKILGLEKLLERRPSQLSGGQRQRVAMGRAIVRDPQVFLFDEPLSNLDAKLRVHMRAEIKGLHQRLRTTIVYVTHDQIEAMTMADRIVVLHDGAVEQIGTPLELYDYPVNQFVAGFIGSPAMNFIKGKIDSTGKWFLAETGERLELNLVPPFSRGRVVTLGVRPEHFVIDGANSLATEIILTEPTGSEMQIIGKFAGQHITAVFRDRLNVRPGDIVKLAPKLDSVHLFDSETGVSIK